MNNKSIAEPEAFGLTPDASGLSTPNLVKSQSTFDDPLPRTKRRKRRALSDRGLPPDDELRKLADAYLSCQRKDWPDLVKVGLLPDSSAAALDEMVADFKNRHRTGKINHQALGQFAGRCKAVGGNYCRFSCDNSEPKSIIDQMVESLEKAREEEHFVPWAYVFADYSVSGLDSSRQGYNDYKAALSAKDTLIKTTYIADFTRASRDEIEWWKLAAISKKLNKGLVGCAPR